MRRAVSSITVAFGLLTVTVGIAGAAVAAPAPDASGAAPAAGEKRCSVTDEKLRELSGLVATKSGYIVVNDSTDVDSHKRIFFLNAECEVTKNVRYSGQGPLDPEDLALSPDGETLWIADIGDNAKQRERVALWTMPVDGSEQPELHRVAYPERKPHDAEALLIGDDGKPLIITKTLSGKAEIFTPTAALKKNNAEPVPMQKVGEIALPKTTTPNVFHGPGRIAITGAARSPDGSRVVLRTYADAFEYDVTGGDIVAALTKGEPRVTPLADPFGEAISYTPDGKLFVTVSDAGELGEDAKVDILAYPPSSKGAAPVAGKSKAKETADRSFLDGLSLDDITYLIAAVGVLGALLVGAGIVGIVRARRRPPEATRRSGDDPYVSGEVPGRDEVDRRGPGRPGAPPPAGREPQRGAVYGGPPAAGGRPAGHGAGNVYGGAAPPAGGAVYGGQGGANVYGGPPGGGRGGYRDGGRGPAGGRGGHGGDGGYGGGTSGGVYGGSRAEPPRRGGPSGRRRGEDEHRRRGGHDPEGYGPANGPGHDYRGTRY
ncbi:hypothetical protein CA850_17895 [Micromonospora echinospora]|uniref:Uncharacterized protein n=1 Tax=Micromonospora echinospora TaxID=1877 RepID=A0A1C4UJH4_MICEC|nr:hypothetical protein [Micromonospora echinospora]OZV79275.1 hypothetical protein CA850_17895 [Micromonospora echinospora]SCE71787.1 hypothetical protein GA0070618_0385 [Micromonospora echinospora]